jgi:hypothetical protein
VWGGYLNTNADTLDSTLLGTIYGLTLSTAGSSTTFAVAAGAASGMVLASTISKTTGSWSVGSTNGSLDTGTVANSTWYHVWLIQRTDTGVVDVLTSLSATAPTMPANYTIKRRIGSMKTNGSAQWTKFIQVGNRFDWTTPIEDADAAPAGTTAASLTLTVPTGVSVEANFQITLYYDSGNGNAYYSALDQDDLTASTYGMLGVNTTTNQAMAPYLIRTNTSAQIRHRYTSTTIIYVCLTTGWIDQRGQS